MEERISSLKWREIIEDLEVLLLTGCLIDRLKEIQHIQIIIYLEDI